MYEPGPLTTPFLQLRLSRWRKRLLLGSLIGVPLCLTTVIIYVIGLPDRELQEAIAEAERLDPGWRMTELQAKRAVIPDEQNSALVVMAAQTLLPTKWQYLDFALGAENRNALWSIEQPVQLQDRQTKALREELRRAEPVLVPLRKVTRLPTGRYPKPVLMGALKIGRLLAYDVLLRAQDPDVDGALASCHCILNCGRASGDEPGPIALLVRIILNQMAT
jgi:hypothetical protein